MGGGDGFYNMAVAHLLCNRTRSSNIWLDPHPHPAFDFIRELLHKLRLAHKLPGELILGPRKTRLSECEVDQYMPFTAQWLRAKGYINK